MRYCRQAPQAGSLVQKTILHIAKCSDKLFQNCGCHKAHVHYRQDIYNRIAEVLPQILFIMVSPPYPESNTPIGVLFVCSVATKMLYQN